MVDNLSELKPGDIVFAGANHFKIHRVTKVDKGRLDRERIEIGCRIESISVKTVPPAFTGGELHKDFYKDFHLYRFVDGDWDKYAAWGGWRWGGCVDVTCAMVAPGEPIKKLGGDLKGITKLDLIAYLIKVHGATPKDDLLRMAAAIEGSPWIPTSNQEYFSNTHDESKRGMLGKNRTATLVHAGKLGRKTLYGIGDEGEERAKKVLARLGEGPAKAAK